MDEAIERAVIRVIETMQERLGESLTIDEMARTAMFSKFHFTRIFQRVTGLSPGRFLSAMRLQRAQELLVTTSLNVTDISYQVGYNSVGTFSSRFTRSVGLSPTAYRQLGGFAPEVPLASGQDPRQPLGTVRGTVLSPLAPQVGHIFVGLFPDQISQGRPVACAVLERPGPYVLPKVPPGTWHLVATSIRRGRRDTHHPKPPAGRALYVQRRPRLRVLPGGVVSLPDIPLRPSRTIDPPMLLALPNVESCVVRCDAVGVPTR